MGREAPAAVSSGPAEEEALPPALTASYVCVLETLCGSDDFRVAARTLLAEVSRATGCEATALRVHDRKDDYPYFVYCGFDESFAEKESRLCERDGQGRVVRCEGGQALLECMCGVVLRGPAETPKPHFTEYGSFWTNSTTDMLAEGSAALEGVRTRNTCSEEGYESVALVPLRSKGGISGLIQANSRERGRFDASVIAFLERIARRAAGALDAAWRREELERLTVEFEERRRGVETMVALGEMAATLAHELKNPLAGMMLSATRLRKAVEGQEKLSAMADHLCASINTLSETVTRVGRSVREPRPELARVHVNEVLERAVSLVAPRAAEQGVVFARELGQELPGVTADAHLLARAYLNLLVNALDAMPDSGMIRLATRLAGPGEIETVIADQGPGVAPGEVERLFRAFETLKPGGTGLGLSIVRRIVELHSGRVELRPAEGGGTEAAVFLPLEA
jgi:signal transduction histidine kinase